MMTDTRSPEGLVEGVGDNIIVNNVGSQLEGLIMTVTREELAIQHPPVIPRDDDDEDSDNNASADESDDGDHSSSDSLSYSRPSMSSGVPGLDMCENNTDCKSASEDVMDSQDEQLERPSLSRDQQPLVKHQDLSHPNGKDLEFDGTNVLCRVCGDKASGFHYGVHSCEGCKGFFRRSIQQKIQYRPCTKNQQCSILRINRNRCQYCRLKKCIAVGMSRDAVRFGRVPKREKAKILAAMQKVNMNSMEKQLNEQLDDESKLLSSLLEAHDETCDFTKVKVAPLIQRARSQPVFASCPSQMACPLNPMPQHMENAAGNRVLEDFSERFSPAIKGVVEFAKRIPGFSLLSLDDQVTLLKAGVFEVLLVRLACMFDSQTNSMICLNGLVLRRESLHTASNARFLMDSMFDFAERMNALQLTDHEIGLFSAVVVIAPDRPGLRNTDLVSKIHRKLDGLLHKTVTANHSSNLGLFAELKKKIPDLRTLNTLHSEKLLACKMEPGRQGLASSTTNVLDTNVHAAAWALNGHSSPNGSDWGSEASKELNEVSYGSPRSVSSSVMSTDEGVKSPSPRSASAASSVKSTSTSNGTSGVSGFESDASRRRLSSSASTASSSHLPIASCPLKRPGATTVSTVSMTNGKPSVSSSTLNIPNGSNGHHHENLSGDECYAGGERPHNKTSSSSSSLKTRRVDSPTDSGIESGKEHCNGSTPTTSVCSSPRSALDEKVKDVTSDSESNEKQETIDDMPMLKRALQAPPLVNTNVLMEEAYRHHKKFRASKREGSSPSPSSTSSTMSTSESGLASSHTTLVKTLEQSPRFMNEQQMKRTDLIHSIIMRSEGSTSSNTTSMDVQLAHPLLHGRLSQYNNGLSNNNNGVNKGVVMTPHGYYIPSSTSSSNGCPSRVSSISPRIMYTASSPPVASYSSPHHSMEGGILPMALQAQTSRRSPSHMSSSPPGLVMEPTNPHLKHHLHPGHHLHPSHHGMKSSPLLMSLTAPLSSSLAINKHQSQSSLDHHSSYDSQPLNLSMSKRASAPNSPTVSTPVKMES